MILGGVMGASIRSVTPLAVGGGSYSTVHRRAESVNVGFGAGPVTLASAVTVANGDKVLVLVSISSGVTRTITGVTANSGAITFTSIGNSTANLDTIHAFYADTSGVTSVNLSFALSGTTQEINVQVISIKGAAAGGASASYFDFRAVTNEDPHDVDGGLSLPSGGSVISMVFGTGVKTWTGATEYAGSEVAGAASGNTFAAAEQTSAGNIHLAGQPGGGPSYSNMVVATVSFAP